MIARRFPKEIFKKTIDKLKKIKYNKDTKKTKKILRKRCLIMTKREMYAEIRKIVADNAEMVAFIDHEVELLDKKKSGSRKPTKTQVENENYKANILAALTEIDEPVTIKGLAEVCPAIAGLTNQRVTHMLTDLRKSGEVKRTYVKKVAYFSLGSEDEVEE